jgi:hypothetical protein
MIEFRCTRPNIYKGNCPGNADPLARQGYYVDAEDEEGAHREMRRKFPHDSHFEVRVWKSPSPRYTASKHV